MTLKGRNLLKMMDFTPEEILYLVDLSAELKEKKHQGIMHDSLVGKNIALIFEKTSTRTRCSFEVAAHDLGMHVTYLDPSGSQIGKKESIPVHLKLMVEVRIFFHKSFKLIIFGSIHTLFNITQLLFHIKYELLNRQ